MRPVPPASSARTGLVEWLFQRVSALYVGGFALWLAVSLLAAPPADFAAWKAWFGSGAVRIAWALFFANILIHAWIGMRSVFIDYLHPFWLRFVAATGTILGLSVLGLWAAGILLRVAS